LPVMLLIGYVLQRTVLERSLRSGIFVPLLTAFGLSLVMQTLLLDKLSPDVRWVGGQAGAVATDSWRPSGKTSIPAIAGIVLGVAQTIGAQIDPQYSVLAGHLVFLAVLASPRGGFFRLRGATI